MPSVLPGPLGRPLALPVLAAPMFLVSGPELVVAQCAAGVIGSFPSLNARPSTQLEDWLAEISERTADGTPYAVNIVVHRANDRLDADLQACADHQVPIVITSLGTRAEVNDAVHAYGGLVLHDVVSDRYAHKAVERGADGLIAVAAGAGGHTGHQSPFALVREIRRWFDGPLVLGGAVAHGSSILAAQAAGADLAYVGSAFLSTHEARATDSYKDMVVGSGADDVVSTSYFSGITASYLRGSIEAVGLDPDRLPQVDPDAPAFARPSDAGEATWRTWHDIWGAGQGIGASDGRTSVAELVDRLRAEHDTAAAELLPRLGRTGVRP